MALSGKLVKSMNAIMIVNNITTFVSKGPEEALHTEQDCISKYASYAFEGAVFCNTVFDTYLCWPPTKANTVIQQNCPKVRLSDPSRFAYRQCGPDGLWEGRGANQASAKGWTNFTPCFPADLQALIVEVFNEHNAQNHILNYRHIVCYPEYLENVNLTTNETMDNEFLTKFQIAENTRILEIIGYVLSLVTVTTSIIIFCYFKSLLNKRVRIHKCLFTTMLFQIFMHLTLYFDQVLNPLNDHLNRLNKKRGIDSTPTLCEIIYIAIECSTSATFTWIFLEGVYLNFLISKNSLQSNIDFKYYYYFGWGCPVVLTGIWAVATWLFYKNDEIKTCWFGYNLAESYWYLQAPRGVIIFINSIVLVRVLMAVISKLRAQKTSELEKILKAIKAACLLLPLLGLTNLLTTFDIPIKTGVEVFRVWCYARQFMKSFQGFFLSLIYCFFNGEVQNVVGRRFNNMATRYRSEISLENTRRPTQQRRAITPLHSVLCNAPQVVSRVNLNEPSTSRAGIPVRVEVYEAGPSGLNANVVRLQLSSSDDDTSPENIPLTNLQLGSNKPKKSDEQATTEETSFTDVPNNK